MKATVFIDGENMEPTTFRGGEGAREELADLFGPVDDVYVVSEWSLRVAANALQIIAAGSSCPGARRNAEDALRAIGQGGDLPTGPNGMPEPVVLKREQIPNENFLTDTWRSDATDR